MTTTTLPKKKLTEASIERMKPPPSGRLQVPDAHITGLWLRVTDKGAKSWSVLYRANGGPVRRLTIGRWPAIKVAEARDMARQALLIAAKGQDPVALKREQREQADDRFEESAAEFVKRVYRLRGLRTTAEVEGMIRKYLLPAWADRRIGTIGKPDVHKVVDAVMDRGHRRQANKVLRLVKQIFRWAERRGLIVLNPAKDVDKPAVDVARDRVLDDDELALVWRGAGALGWPWRDYTRLLVLLGQRRSEVASMRWGDLDLDAGVWRMPAETTKMSRSRVLPLPVAAVAIIEALPRIGGSPLVFPANRPGSTKPISGFSKLKRHIDAAIAVASAERRLGRPLGEGEESADEDALPEWHLHDLRRTLATGMQKLGVALPVTEAVLGHSASRAGVIGIYQRYDFAAEQRVALEKWSEHVARVVSGEGAKVVRLA